MKAHSYRGSIFLLALLLTGISLHSQVSNGGHENKSTKGCHTPVPAAEWDKWFNKLVEERNVQNSTSKVAAAGYTIPVIVHVIHSGQNVGVYPNISQAQIKSQITTLNYDYSGIGYKVSTVPSAFAPLVANTNIKFVLTQVDADGFTLAEPGIERIHYNTLGVADPTTQTSSTGFQTYFDTKIKPVTIWDPTRFMNIWVSDVNNVVDIIGYATLPVGTGLNGIFNGNGDASTDGVWILAKTFGTTGTLISPYDKGRTATHEIGHWLGLRHTWGDANCGDDFCGDTPVQQTSNSGCPAFPHVTCSNGPNGDMFMNFMDYCDDACNYMFTHNQSARMQTAMANGTYRKNLTASSFTACNVSSQAPVAAFAISNSACVNTPVHVLNQSDGSPVPTFFWSAGASGGISFSPSDSSPMPSFVATSPGTYTISVAATNSLGSSSTTRVIYIDACGTNALKQVPEALEAQLIPNPTAGRFTISGGYGYENLGIIIHNSLGQKVFSIENTGVQTNDITVDLTSQPDGIYILTLRSGSVKSVKRLVLAR